MADYFYQIVRDAINYDHTEDQAAFYALELINMKDWCEEMLDMADVPRGPYRTAVMTEMFAGDSDVPYRLWRYIQDTCFPDPEE